MAKGDSKVVDLENLNPEFRRRMGNFLTAAKKEGIPAHIIEAYRDRAVQAQYYADKLKGLRPYPVAPPGTSFHEGGFASDTLTDDPKRQRDLINFANQHPEFGIVPLPGDAPHFQIAGYRHLADAIKNPPALGEGPQVDLSPFIAAGQGYSIGKGTQLAAVTTPVAGALAKQAVAPTGNSFLDSLAQVESNNQNIFSGVDKDYPGQPGSRSQGYFQIDTPTWQQFAAKAGVDTVKYPSAMNAPREVQAQVAQLIPFSRFGQRTQDMLTKQYGALDKKATIGALAGKFGGSAPATPGTATASAAPTAPADEGTWWQKAYGALVDKPKDAQGNPTGKPSPYEQFAETMAKGPERMKALEEAQAPQSVQNYAGTAPAARNVSPGLANIAQTYGQTLNSIMQPLTWNNAPPRAPQMAAGGFQPAPGSQIPGMSLNSFLPPSQGIGYGIDPVGFGYG